MDIAEDVKGTYLGLTQKQHELLTWIGSQAAGVTDITDRRIARPLQNRGLLTYDMFRDAWFVTSLGRQALASAIRSGER